MMTIKELIREATLNRVRIVFGTDTDERTIQMLHDLREDWRLYRQRGILVSRYVEHWQ